MEGRRSSEVEERRSSGGAEEQWSASGALKLDLESTSQRTCGRRNDGIGREGGGLG